MTKRDRTGWKGKELVAGIFVAMALLGRDALADDAGHGKELFQANCAICHSDTSDVAKLGPSLLGVMGRKAGNAPGFNYTKALSDSGLTWDAPSLDHFLESPATAVPGTAMIISTANAQDRKDIIGYLATLKSAAPAAAASPAPTASSGTGDPNDWQNEKPGLKHHFTLADLPEPFATRSAGNGPKNVPRPPDAIPAAPSGFTVKLFASGLQNPRLLRTAPNGDIFVACPGSHRIQVMRAAAGTDTPTENQTYAAGIDRPFGLAFYPPGKNPKWLYVALNNSVIRYAYKNGDLQAQAGPEIIVPQLCGSNGGHSTRDLAFSKDGKRMFISVGSGSNVADSMSKKSPDEIKAWDAEHGKGAAWDAETNRADILVTDPEGKSPLHTYATGIRNGVGIAVDPGTGKLWVSTNERDGLGDNLVPEYISSVKEGGYYGWPWYYLGNHEDPRRKGERPDLAGQAIVPDVLVQSHSASLQLTFYPAAPTGPASFPAEFHGDIFAAEHGSWNRTTRTGYKVIRVRMKDGVATGEYEDFLTGFVVDDQSVWGRPVGVTVASDGALLVSEDGNGTIWRVAPMAK